MTVADGALLTAAAAAAGVVNAIAGGGTLLTFPALLGAGVPPVAANATNTVALFPGQLASSFAYRSHIADERQRAIVLAVPSLIGGVLGAWLLLALPERAFAIAVPWLILFACVVLAFQGQLKHLVARARHANHPAALWFAQLAIAIYGGYFGAGIGILMLASLSLMGLRDIHRMNGLKTILGMLINVIAFVFFAVKGLVVWPLAAVMAAGAVAGGWVGARAALRVDQRWIRRFVIGVGLVVSAWLFVKP